MTSAAGELPAEEAPEVREHVAGVLGVFVGILVLLGSLAGLFLVRGGDLDGPERLAVLMGAGPYVFGLELVESAQLPTGEVVLRLERAPAPGAGPGADVPDAPPIEVVLVEFTGPEAALAAFRGESGDFGGERPGGGRGGMGPPRDEHGGGFHGASATLLRWEENPDFAWHTSIQSDDIAWSRWRADYRIERSFLVGGSWRDSARVNLSQKGRSLVLYARWPDETEVPLPALRELLRSVRMLEADEA